MSSELRGESQGQRSPMPDAAVAPAASSRQRVLLMDDEESVCSVVKRMLEHLGYQADAVGDGADALSLYERALRQGWRYDAVILDLRVPVGMGGLETLARLRELDAGVRAFASSGWSLEDVMVDCEKGGFSGLLSKPFRLAQLESLLARGARSQESGEGSGAKSEVSGEESGASRPYTREKGLLAPDSQLLAPIGRVLCAC